jgi:SAM-dependent methyltransferase
LTPQGDPPAGPAASEDWFAHWFGREYLELYPHRDEEEAERAVELIVRHADLPPGSAALDLACGAGRHVAALREAGLQALGLDLSHDLLLLAARDGLAVVRGDMRALPLASGRLSLVTSFFTSFGYFEDPDDDEAVIEEVRRVLRPGGLFAVDFLNADRVRAGLRDRDEVELGRRRVIQTRELVDGGSVVQKRIEIVEQGRGEPRVFLERVRLYTAEELERIMARHGLRLEASFGDYGGGPPRPEAPRVILIGRAA